MAQPPGADTNNGARGDEADVPDTATRRITNSFTARSPFCSFSNPGPWAEASLAADIEEEPDRFLIERSPSDSDEEQSDASSLRPQFAMIGSYRRPSFLASGLRPTVFQPTVLPENVYLTRDERERVREEERSLLRDNAVIPPKHTHKRIKRQGSESNIAGRVSKRISLPGLRKVKTVPDEERPDNGHGRDELPTETTALLGRDPTQPYGGEASPENIARKWEDAVEAGQINTTWQRETKVLVRFSVPLFLTFFLQYSFTMASIFTVGHLGKVELGAVSLGTMTANITGYAVYQGLATSLDTLCAQAFGSGRKTLVGLQLQRMVYFLWLITIPIGIVWLSGSAILSAIVPDQETAALAGLYLKVLLLGAPGYAAFESGKRYVQAQGLFDANLYVLLICAPLNALMNWAFVWYFKWGYIGAPIAVAITDNLLPLVLFLYVYFIDGRACWGGFDKRALQNWGPMVKLALPGLIMILAEWLAFEILTLASSWLSTTHLAAQSVLSAVATTMYMFPFSVSIAASTRIANLIGATLDEPAKVAARVDMVAACFVGALNMTLLSSLRAYLPRLFTNDQGVVDLVASVLPLCAAFQLFDSLAATCNGILRGLGRQEVGGYVSLFAYYVIAMPISFSTGFGLHWGLYGLWAGPAIALAIVSGIEGLFIYRTSWKAAVEQATNRIHAG